MRSYRRECPEPASPAFLVWEAAWDVYEEAGRELSALLHKKSETFPRSDLDMHLINRAWQKEEAAHQAFRDATDAYNGSDMSAHQ